MGIYHHKPSMELARARQLRGYGFIWIYKHKRGKQMKTGIEKKRNFDSIQITMKEKITYTGATPSTNLFYSSIKVSSPLSYIKKIKII